MAEDAIPKDVRNFLATHIPSVSHLELLLFLFDGRERAWSTEELIRELRSNDQHARQQLSDLSKVIESNSDGKNNYKFDSKNPKTLETVRKIAELYRSRRHAVIHEIYAKPIATIQSFADAFKLKKEE